MKYLLDTHAVIWHLEDSPRLPPRTKELIDGNAEHLCLCSVSLWEIAIKVGRGKLDLQFTFEEFLDEVQDSDIELLHIKDDHLKRLIVLPSIHKDPFDRLLVATALVENLTIITADENIRRYGVPWTW